MRNKSLLIILCCFYTCLSAQWVKTNGPLGITTEAFIERNGILFTGTNPHGIYKSLDHGLTWTESNSVATEHLEVTCFASDKTYLYAGTLEDGVYRSPDNGNTWQPLTAGVHPSGLSCLLIANGYLFAGDILDGIYRSNDHGTTWTNINQNLLDFTYIKAMVSQKHRLMVEGDNYIFYSYDNGDTWDVDQGPTAFYAFDKFFHHGDTLLASTGIIIFRSIDGGRHWKGPQIMSSSLCGFASKNDTVYACSRDGLFRSADWGATWTLIKSPDLRFGSRYQHSFIISGNNFITGYQEIGPYVSRNRGLTWKQAPLEQFTRGSTIDDAIITYKNTVFTGTHTNGVFKSTDRGDTWTKIGTPNPLDTLSNAVVFAMLHIDTSIILAGTGDYGLYRSKDNGNTWTHIITGLVRSTSRQQIKSLALSGSNVVMARGDGVYYSTNKGLTWHKSTINGNPQVLEASGLAVHGRVVCVGITASPGRGIYRSTDNGVTFSLTDPLLDISCLKEGGGTYMYAGSLFSVSVSANNGKNWNPVGPGIPAGGGAFSILAWDKYVFVGNNFGVFFSNDNGASFTDASLGLDPYPHNVVAGLAKDGAFLYAGTDKAAIWRRPLTDFGILPKKQFEGELTQKPTTSISIDPVISPNPFVDRFTVRVKSITSGAFNLHLLSIDGKVLKIVSGTLHEGQNLVIVDGLANLKPGTYVLEMETMEGTKSYKMVK